MNQQSPSPEFTEKQIRAGLRINILAASSGMVWFGITQGLPLIMMMEALGATGVMIGMISMLNQSAMLIQIPASLLADRLIYRKKFWFLTTIIARFIWLLPALLMLFYKGSAAPVIHGTLAVVGISALLIQSSASSWWSWMADLIPEQLRSRFWSIRQGLCMTSMLLTFAVTGWFLDLFPKGSRTGFGFVLLASAVFGVMDILIHRRVPEPAAQPAAPGIPLGTRLLRPLKDQNFRYFTLVMGIWFFGLGLIGPFTMVYLKQAFNALYSHLSIIQIAALLGSIGTSFYSGRLIRRAGIRTFGMLMLVLAPLFSIAWFFVDSSSVTLKIPFTGNLSVPQFTVLLACTSLLSGSVFAAVGIYQLNMLTSIVPRDGRTSAMAVHWSLVGLSSALAPIAAGWIKDILAVHPIHLPLYHGTAFSFMHILLILHAALIWLLALPLARKLKSVPTDMTVVEALSHIFITNPLRMARDIYGFNGVIISSVEKTRDLVMQSAGMALDAVAQSAEIAKGAMQKLLNNDQKPDDPSGEEK